MQTSNPQTSHRWSASLGVSLRKHTPHMKVILVALVVRSVMSSTSLVLFLLSVKSGDYFVVFSKNSSRSTLQNFRRLTFRRANNYEKTIMCLDICFAFILFPIASWEGSDHALRPRQHHHRRHPATNPINILTVGSRLAMKY